jgi:hypothetical protein
VASSGCGWMETCIVGEATPVQPSTMRCWPGRSSSASKSWRPGFLADAPVSFPEQQVLRWAPRCCPGFSSTGQPLCLKQDSEGPSWWQLSDGLLVAWGLNLGTGQALIHRGDFEGVKDTPYPRSRVPHENYFYRNSIVNVHCRKPRRHPKILIV